MSTAAALSISSALPLRLLGLLFHFLTITVMMIVVMVIIVMILIMVIMLMSSCPLMTRMMNGWAMVYGPVTAMETGRAIPVMVTAAISRIVIIMSRIQEMTVILIQWPVH